MGKFILDMLDILYVRPICFYDNDVEKQHELFHGYDVVPFDNLCAEHSDAQIIIAAER